MREHTVRLNARERAYYTVAEAAAVLDVSRTTIWRWIERGRLPAYRVGARMIRIRREDLEAVVSPARVKRTEVLTALEDKPGQGAVPTRDIWAGYDPVKVKEALRRSVGALAGVKRELLLKDIQAGREQDSHGRPA